MSLISFFSIMWVVLVEWMDFVGEELDESPALNTMLMPTETIKVPSPSASVLTVQHAHLFHMALLTSLFWSVILSFRTASWVPGRVMSYLVRSFDGLQSRRLQAQLDKARTDHQAAIRQAWAENRIMQDSCARTHSAELDTMRLEHNQEIGRLQAELGTMRTEHTAEIESARLRGERQLELQKDRFTRAKISQKESSDSVISSLTENLVNANQQARTDGKHANERIAKLEESLTRAKKIEDEATEELIDVKVDLRICESEKNGIITDLKSDLAKSQAELKEAKRIIASQEATVAAKEAWAELKEKLKLSEESALIYRVQATTSAQAERKVGMWRRRLRAKTHQVKIRAKKLKLDEKNCSLAIAMSLGYLDKQPPFESAGAAEMSRKELSEAKGKLSKAEKELRDVQSKLSATEKELSESRSKHTASQTKRSKEQKRLANDPEKLSKAQKSEDDKKLASAAEALTLAKKKIIELEAAATSSKGRLDSACSEVKRAEEALKTSQDLLTAAKQSQSDDKTRLSSAVEEAKLAKTTIDALKTAATSFKAQLDSLQSDTKSAKEALKTSQADLAAEKRSRKEADSKRAAAATSSKEQLDSAQKDIEHAKEALKKSQAELVAEKRSREAVDLKRAEADLKKQQLEMEVHKRQEEEAQKRQEEINELKAQLLSKTTELAQLSLFVDGPEDLNVDMEDLQHIQEPTNISQQAESAEHQGLNKRATTNVWMDPTMHVDAERASLYGAGLHSEENVTMEDTGDVLLDPTMHANLGMASPHESARDFDNNVQMDEGDHEDEDDILDWRETSEDHSMQVHVMSTEPHETAPQIEMADAEDEGKDQEWEPVIAPSRQSSVLSPPGSLSPPQEEVNYSEGYFTSLLGNADFGIDAGSDGLELVLGPANEGQPSWPPVPSTFGFSFPPPPPPPPPPPSSPPPPSPPPLYPPPPSYPPSPFTHSPEGTTPYYSSPPTAAAAPETGPRSSPSPFSWKMGKPLPGLATISAPQSLQPPPDPKVSSLTNLENLANFDSGTPTIGLPPLPAKLQSDLEEAVASSDENAKPRKKRVPKSRKTKK